MLVLGRRAASVVFAGIVSAGGVHAQAPVRVETPCPPVAKSPAPTDDQKREARTVAEQARQASIVDGSRTARDLFKRAVQLDPTDANNIYALARLYDDAKESRSALTEYCRFIALSPNADETENVKNRVTELAQEIARTRPQTVTRLVVPPETVIVHPPDDNSVFALATVMPGLGQYYTQRPVLGAAVTAASLGALYWGLQSKNRANTAAGVTLSVGVSVLGAIESYLHVHGPDRRHQSSKTIPRVHK